MGRGAFQKCYIHPNNENLCIKISDPTTGDKTRFSSEMKYYNKIKNRDTSKFEYAFYARYHGEAMTNLGVGFVYDLIRDETTQKISLTLADYLKMPNCPFADTLFINGLERLKQQMIKHKIIVRDLSGENICCKILKNESIELVVIDGVGHRDFLPLADWVHVFTKKKVKRIFFKKRLNSLSDHREFLKNLNRRQNY